MTTPPPGAETVCAVVVTFNRLAMLRRCVECLQGQTRLPDATVVVNNGSTDGTAEWLQGRGGGGGFSTITQANLGSAGGVNAGMRHAFEAGFTWVWLMDDDLVLPPGALKTLLADARRADLDLVNPLVAADAEPDALAFGLSPTIKTVGAAREAARDGLIAGLMNPFNGLLVHRRAMERIGFVKAEMFISGDEIEYVHRANAHGLAVATSTGVVCLHPKPRFAYQPIVFGRFEVELPSGLRRWIFIRNVGYINARYRGVYALLRDAFKYGWFFVFADRSEPGALGRCFRYYLDGIRDRYALPPTRGEVAVQPPVKFE